MLPNDEFNSARLNNMRASIHEYLSNGKVYDSIREIVEAYITENPQRAADSDGIMNILKERGVLKSLLTTITGSESSTNANHRFTTRWKLDDGEHYLHVRLNGGRAFVDNIDIKRPQNKNKMYVGIHFGYQRHRSSFTECRCDPAFDDDFLLHLDPTSFGFSPHDLIEISTPLHIGVFREDVDRNTSELIGENVIDWRKVLNSGFLGVTVELCGSNSGVPSGIIDLDLEIVPNIGRHSYTEDEIGQRLEQQRSAITAADREFLLYARRWWNEYQSFRPTHKNRKVKVFAATTNGRMVPVTHFVSPLQGEGIHSPYEAARFVSLLNATKPRNDLQVVDGSEGTLWLSPFVFLSQRQGYTSNHSNLLCSLLLGFGLDAFSCIGTNSSGNVATFVVTHAGGGWSDVVLWDAELGERYSLNSMHGFSTIDCMYNHKSFYANCQQSTSIEAVSFDIENEEWWKPINPLKLRLVPKFPNAPLLYEPLHLIELERGLEFRLRAAVTAHRDSIGVQTVFDDNLSYVLSQALILYERQKVLCREEEFSVFAQSVKGTVGPGMTFKGIPINATNEDEGNILRLVLESEAGVRILDTVGEDVKFGIRAKIFTFPEGVRSVWILLAAAYRIRV